MKRELPKAYEPAKYEDAIYAKWEKSGYFNPDNLELNQDAESYTISMPLPNRTGNLHIGHALMLTLQDILTRYHRMRGERALWLPGTDHAAIATQTKVEKILKEEGTNRHELGRERFLERVRRFAQESHDTIIMQIKKMGCSCDWSREAYTLDEIRTRAVQSVFKLMYDDGLIYRGERIVNWCPRCHSTLADDEVEYKTQTAEFYTFRYGPDFPFAIATTRPETKLGDTAVAVNPKDKRYKKYIGKTFEVDFVGVPLKLRIIADRNVDPEFGTGALGVTPAHSMADWQMAEENGLDIIKVIDEDGKIIADERLGAYGGLTVDEARSAVVARLREAGLLEKEEDVENNLSLCYRCDTPIEPLPSLQWFIDVNKKIPKYGKSIKELSIEAVKSGVFGRDKIRIVPERFEKNYFHWMDNLRDWCISRQIWFGHRVPVWYRQHENIKTLKRENKRKIYVGVESPEGDGWVQDEDTLDTWFSSGLWTFSTLADKPEQISVKDGKLHIDSEDFRNFHPTNVLETGYDILFFWVARMIIMTTYALGDIPFQDVYLHGLIRDEQGRKMSKSLGNVIDPLDMIKKYGTDATRLSLVLGTTPGNDMNLGEDKVAGYRNFANKLWNISRYILATVKTGKNGQAGDVLPELGTMSDGWIITNLNSLIVAVSEDLDNYRFSQAGESLREFTWNYLADWYLEAAKFERNKDEILIYILKRLLKLWHPFIPFVTEAIWEEFSDGSSLMVQGWPDYQEYDMNTVDIKHKADFDLIREIITAIRNARAANKIEPSRKIKAVIYADKHKELVDSQEIIIKNLRTGIDELKIKAKGDKIDNAIYVPVGDIDIYLIVAVDEVKERARIEKEITGLEKLIANTEKKLANRPFVEKAPAEVVDRERKKLETWQGEIKKIRESL